LVALGAALRFLEKRRLLHAGIKLTNSNPDGFVGYASNPGLRHGYAISRPTPPRMKFSAAVAPMRDHFHCD